MTKRVAITGIGCVTPIGIGTDALWRGILEGRSAVKKLSRFDTTGLHSQIAATVDDFDAATYLDMKSARRLDRFSQFSVACAQMALEDSKFPLQGERDDIGVYIGSALGGVAQAEAEHTKFVRDGFSAVNKLIALSVFNGAGACNVSIAFKLQGPSLSNANSCASGAIAIGEAFRLIRSGQVVAMVAGGAEAPLSPLCFGAFDLIRAMSTQNETPQRASRPFDRTRDGFVMAEGAAVFVLEDLEHARKRGAKIYAEVLGYGVTSDAHHMTVPRADGTQAARAVTLALREANVSPSDLDAINAHGSSTPLNDKTETLALKISLGEAEARRIPISATKAMHGHALGASGAMEMAISLLALEKSVLPPTINLEHADPDCDLDYVPHVSRTKRIKKLLTHSFGFGGTNAALVIGEPN